MALSFKLIPSFSLFLNQQAGQGVGQGRAGQGQGQGRGGVGAPKGARGARGAGFSTGPEENPGLSWVLPWLWKAGERLGSLCTIEVEGRP